MGDFPTGIVTLLFSEIEGSTQLWARQPAVMQTASARYAALMQQAIESHHGFVFKTMGDSFFAVFANAIDAVSAAAAAQHALHSADWGEHAHALPSQVRMALHTGEAELHADDYVGALLVRAARLLTAAQAGQTLLSSATQELVSANLPLGMDLHDLGERPLDEGAMVERIFQLVPTVETAAVAQPIVCSSCGAAHLPNTLFCDQCGHLLSQTLAGDTDALAMPDTPAARGSSSTTLKMVLTTLDGQKQFPCVLTTSLLVGRTDTASGSYPDVDLGNLQGFESGVSRRHARLLRSEQQVLLEDLNSLNGTFVQNVRLHAHHPHVLQSGDELQFGKVSLKITWSH